jgi:hypothetical protein
MTIAHVAVSLDGVRRVHVGVMDHGCSQPCRLVLGGAGLEVMSRHVSKSGHDMRVPRGDR